MLSVVAQGVLIPVPLKEEASKVAYSIVIMSALMTVSNNIWAYFMLSELCRSRYCNSGNVRPCVTGHPAWRDAADTSQHNKRNNGLEVYRLSG
jgi:hypothetical protein